jgi:uroporphyrinogen decarboxylase
MVTTNLDVMTPKERITAWKAGQPYDRIPCGVSVGEQAAKLAGFGPKDYPLSPANSAKVQITAYKKFGQETVSGGFNLADEVIKKLVLQTGETLKPGEFPLKNKKNISKLEILEPLQTRSFLKGVETLQILLDAVGDEVPAGTHINGPMTFAGRLRGAEDLMRDIYYDPEFVHELLDLCVKITIPFVRELAKYDVTISIMDPVSSGSLIGPKIFNTFSYPYQKQLIKEISDTSRPPNLHICGNINNILEYMADSGAGLIMNIDELVDLENVKQKIGHKIAFSGNLRSVDSVLLGTPQTVEENVKECLRKAWDSPKGYIVSLDGLPKAAPAENVHAIFDAVRKYGQYPLNPALFS